MKRTFLALIGGFSAWAAAQSDGEIRLRQLIATTTPQASVVVREDTSASDIVEITMLNPGFPTQELTSIVNRIGANTGAGVRGVYVYNTTKSGDPSNFVKAKFGTDNIIDHGKGILNLQAIARSFAGVAKPFEITGLLVSFTDQTPTTNTIRSYANEHLALLANVQRSPLALEYRIRILSQDPAKISIPERIQDTVPSKTPAPQPAKRPVLGYVLLALGSVAVGALVYFLASAAGSARSRR